MNYDKLFVGDAWKVPLKYYPLLFVATLVALIQYPFLRIRNHFIRISNGRYKGKL